MALGFRQQDRTGEGPFGGMQKWKDNGLTEERGKQGQGSSLSYSSNCPVLVRPSLGGARLRSSLNSGPRRPKATLHAQALPSLHPPRPAPAPGTPPLHPPEAQGLWAGRNFKKHLTFLHHSPASTPLL